MKTKENGEMKNEQKKNKRSGAPANMAVSDEELEKVVGGAHYESAMGTYKISCSTPGCMLNSDIEPTCWDPDCLVCPFCKTGTLTYTFTPYGN